MTALKFWTWLRDFANEKVKHAHMRIYGHARKCRNCNTWTSEVGGCASITDCSLFFKGDRMGEIMECKKCGHKSVWDCTGYLPVATDRVPL